MFGWIFGRATVPDRLTLEGVRQPLFAGCTELHGVDPSGRTRVIRVAVRPAEAGGVTVTVSLDRCTLPRGGEAERALVRLLRTCLDGLRPGPGTEGPGGAERCDALSGFASALFGVEVNLNLTAEDLSERGRLIRMVSTMLEWIEERGGPDRAAGVPPGPAG